MRRQKDRALLALIFILLLTLPGCGTTAGKISSGSRSPEETAVPPAVSAGEKPELRATPDPTPEPLKELEGVITGASKSVLELRAAGGEEYTIFLTDETEHVGENLELGNSAVVSYRESECTGQGIKALKLEINAGKHRDTIAVLLESMTLEEKIGQMFFVRCPDNAAEEAAKFQFGGYILFDADFRGETPESIRTKLQQYQNAVKLPLLVGVDEEGGEVVRVSDKPGFCEEPYWSPRELYAAGGLELVLSVEKDKVELLSSLGVNVNFAPVCDIAGDEDDFMYSRSLGQDAETTSEFIRQTVLLYSEHSMGCVLKHFPGYGDNPDTHKGIALDERELTEFETRDFLPFSAGIQEGAECVLVSHNIVSCLDKTVPASLSEEWHSLLRGELGFTGCIITDDLSMGAIRKCCDIQAAAIQAIKAGNDLLCCTDYGIQLPAVIEAVRTGEISEERIEESVRRILAWKLRLGLLPEDAVLS